MGREPNYRFQDITSKAKPVLVDVVSIEAIDKNPRVDGNAGIDKVPV